MAFKSLKEVKKPLAGGTLTVTQFPVLRAIRIGSRVIKLVSPVFAGLGGGLDLERIVNGGVSSANLDLNKGIPAALMSLAETLDPEAFATLCQDLLSGATWVDGAGTEQADFSNPVDINRVLGGSIPDLFTALRAALEANDFFGLGAIGKLRGLVRAPSPQPPPAVSTPT
jgi:hypothetical protein